MEGYARAYSCSSCTNSLPTSGARCETVEWKDCAVQKRRRSGGCIQCIVHMHAGRRAEAAKYIYSPELVAMESLSGYLEAVEGSGAMTRWCEALHYFA